MEIFRSDPNKTPAVGSSNQLHDSRGRRQLFLKVEEVSSASIDLIPRLEPKESLCIKSTLEFSERNAVGATPLSSTR